MNGAHGCRESESVGLGSDLGDDFVETKVLLRKLLGGTSDPEELGLDIDTISDVQLRRRCTAMVGRSLVSELCFTDILLEMLVEFLEVDCEFMSASGGEGVFGVNGDVRMVALVGEEWRDTRSIAWGVVVGKLRERQEFGPVVLLIVAVNSEVLLESLVSTFRLSVGFWVVSGGEVQVHAESLAQSAEESRDELQATIGGDMRRSSMLGEDMNNE